MSNFGMLPIFFSITIKLNRSGFDAFFVRVLDDSNMRETVKKSPNAFVFFHADHIPNSDCAYKNFVSVARQYKNRADFYVVPASIESDVARTYGVPGNPSLLHIRLGTKNGIHNGLFSQASIKRFVSNWTSASTKELLIKDDQNITEGMIMNELISISEKNTHALLIVGKTDSEFVKASMKMAEELSPYFTCIRSDSEKLAEALKIPFPSLVEYRFEDSQRFIYDEEEIDPDMMFIWVQRFSIPKFRRLDLLRLFSADGITSKNLISFIDETDDEMVFNADRALGKLDRPTNLQGLYFADITESAALANLLNITKVPTTVYLESNFTRLGYHIVEGYADNETTFKFADDLLSMEHIQTPAPMYGDMRAVTEMAFEEMLGEGPFFALFNSRFCTKCKTLKMAAFDAASTIRRNGGNVKWASWDITMATPSFSKELDIGIPSVWYFPDNNVMHGVLYEGPQNYLSIIEWVANKQPDAFDIESIMEHELGNRFDEI